MPYAIIIAFTYLLFHRTFKFGWCPDDELSARTVDKYKNRFKSLNTIRPNNIFLMLYGAGLFKNKTYDHMLTTALNAVIGCLIAKAFNNVWLAALWLAHPINNQVTIWLNGRRYQMSIIFGLLCLIFPKAGWLLYPLALFFHPISIPFIVFPALNGNLSVFTWLIFMGVLVVKYRNWLSSRFDLQPFEMYRRFEIGKIWLAINSLSEYILHFLFPRGFLMYHPRIWGIAELPGNKARNLTLTASTACSSVVILLAMVGYALSPDHVQTALLTGLAGVGMWCGLIINPVQLWSQRYMAVTSLFWLLGLLYAIDLMPYEYQLSSRCALLAYYIAVTLKDMGMYRSIYDFFMFQTINDPKNQNAHYFGAVGIDNEAGRFMEDGKKLEAVMCSAYATSMGFHWCMYNPKPDLIHTFLQKKLKKN